MANANTQSLVGDVFREVLPGLRLRCFAIQENLGKDNKANFTIG